MSSDALPVAPGDFARALESLPPETLHEKAAEIQNSIVHLKSSNDQMMPYADEGDQDCKEAMFENLVVIGRMNERVKLLREEIEKRGLRWADAEVEDAKLRAAAKTNGHVEGDGAGAEDRQEVREAARQQGGRLTDDELRRRLEAQMADDEEEGVHL